MEFRAPKGASKINVLLVGGVGAGKSSIVSTLDSLFRGRLSRKAAHGQALTGSFTRSLTKYSFRHERAADYGIEEAQEAPFVLWDSPGWSDTLYQNGELGYILDGNLPNRFDLTQAISPQSHNFVVAPDLADRVHCVCFVVPCQAGSNADYMRRLKELKKDAMDRGIPTLVFLTKVDQYDAEADISRLENSQRIKTIVQDSDQESADWEAVPLKQANPYCVDEKVDDRSTDATTK
ncbi:probable interferon-induced protein 44 [Coccomyxa sp. Obi]|nr:probable interferon-induced protein 44 [Coccomyxa sp. Obi]